MRRIEDAYWLYSWNDADDAKDPDSEFSSLSSLDGLKAVADDHIARKRTIIIGEGPAFMATKTTHVLKILRTLKQGDC